jgi:hypothetical protein
VTASVEAARRAAAVACVLEACRAGKAQLDEALVESLRRLAGKAAFWSAVTEERGVL